MINICFCSDINLIKHIPIVIMSILNNNKDDLINIYYIHNIKDQTKIKELENFIHKFSNLTFIHFYQEWKIEYKGMSHISSATMLRLFIPKLINVSKIIYLDIDIIVNIDLNKLFNLETNYKGICMTNGIINKLLKNRLGNRKVGNAGIILMDLDKLRTNNFFNKCLNIHRQIKSHDQDVINCFCFGKYTSLDKKFNLFINKDDPNNYTEYIYHFKGKHKPYNSNVGKYQYLWDENYKKYLELIKI